MNYNIQGGSFPVLICELNQNEAMISQGGGMSWMSPNMKMETTGGGMKKILGRMFTGESLFQNRYTAQNGAGTIAFASALPGEILPLEIGSGREYICQKTAFLASTTGVELSVSFQKKAKVGFFGGEGFVMQKLSGNGMAFVEVDGAAIRYNLKAGESIIADTGHLVLMDSSCSIDVQTVKGAKNIFFGGEGLFNTVISGPGEVVLQTMPISKLAESIVPYIPTSSGSSD